MKNIIPRQNILALVLTSSFTLLCAIWIVSSMAQSLPSEGQASGKWTIRKVGAKRLNRKEKLPEQADSSVRVIEDQIPTHIPIKVDLGNLEAEPLYRNLEVKVTNTSNKPIYYLELMIVLPDVQAPEGAATILPLRYGRTKLINFQEPIKAEDVPIRPGESYVLKATEKYLGRLERYFDKIKFARSEIKTIQVAFQELNFGDQTGYSTTGGIAIPNGG